MDRLIIRVQITVTDTLGNEDSLLPFDSGEVYVDETDLQHYAETVAGKINDLLDADTATPEIIKSEIESHEWQLLGDNPSAGE